MIPNTDEQMLAHLNQRMEEVKGEKDRMVKEKQFESAAALRDTERKLQQDIDALEKVRKITNSMNEFLNKEAGTIPVNPQLKAHGTRYNDGKLKWSYVHFASLEPMVRVLMFGAQKYEPFNWQKGLKKDEILESMQRHLAKLIDGEVNDPESGLPHIGHIQCNAMFYQYMVNKEPELQGGKVRFLPIQLLEDLIPKTGPDMNVRQG